MVRIAFADAARAAILRAMLAVLAVLARIAWIAPGTSRKASIESNSTHQEDGECTRPYSPFEQHCEPLV
jgi:hypothetical protein